MFSVRDDRGRELTFVSPPKRIVSLVPSDTFTLTQLGCAGALVGRTDFCETPADLVGRVPTVGGTKNPSVDAICDLSPDLVLANQEENTRGDLEQLVRRGIRVYVAFPCRVEAGLAHVARLARALGVEAEPLAKDLVRRGYEELRVARAARVGLTPVRTFCPIWMNPLMTIHGATFISDMLDLCGAQNVFSDRERRYPLAADMGSAPPLSPDAVGERDVRYPRVTLEEVKQRAPELILLPDEPHPFSDEDAAVFSAQFSKVVPVSGKDVCWSGAWTVEGLPRLRAMIAACS